MKKLITLAVIATLSLTTVAFANEATVTAITAVPTDAESAVVTVISVDIETTSDEAVSIIAKPPVVDRATGEILLPSRETAVELGYEVAWNANDKSITFTKDGNVFGAQVGSTEYTYNGKVILTAPATIIVDGYSYVPTSFVNAMKPAVETPQISDPTGSQIK